MGEIIESLAEAGPELADAAFECVQTATARYDESGFTAAAITALAAATGAPEFVERTIAWLNLLAAPLLVTLAGLLYAIIRRRRAA